MRAGSHLTSNADAGFIGGAGRTRFVAVVCVEDQMLLAFFAALLWHTWAGMGYACPPGPVPRVPSGWIAGHEGVAAYIGRKAMIPVMKSPNPAAVAVNVAAAEPDKD